MTLSLGLDGVIYIYDVAAEALQTLLRGKWGQPGSLSPLDEPTEIFPRFGRDVEGYLEYLSLDFNEALADAFGELIPLLDLDSPFEDTGSLDG